MPFEVQGVVLWTYRMKLQLYRRIVTQLPNRTSPRRASEEEEEGESGRVDWERSKSRRRLHLGGESAALLRVSYFSVTFTLSINRKPRFVYTPRLSLASLSGWPSASAQVEGGYQRP